MSQVLRVFRQALINQYWHWITSLILILVCLLITIESSAQAPVVYHAFSLTRDTLTPLYFSAELHGLDETILPVLPERRNRQTSDEWLLVVLPPDDSFSVMPVALDVCLKGSWTNTLMSGWLSERIKIPLTTLNGNNGLFTLPARIHTPCSRIQWSTGDITSFWPPSGNETLYSVGLQLLEIPPPDPQEPDQLPEAGPDIKSSLFSYFYRGKPFFLPPRANPSNLLEINVHAALLSLANAPDAPPVPGIRIDVVDAMGHQWPSQFYTMEEAEALLANVTDIGSLLSKMHSARMTVSVGQVDDLSRLCRENMARLADLLSEYYNRGMMTVPNGSGQAQASGSGVNRDVAFDPSIAKSVGVHVNQAPNGQDKSVHSSGSDDHDPPGGASRATQCREPSLAQLQLANEAIKNELSVNGLYYYQSLHQNWNLLLQDVFLVPYCDGASSPQSLKHVPVPANGEAVERALHPYLTESTLAENSSFAPLYSALALWVQGVPAAEQLKALRFFRQLDLLPEREQLKLLAEQMFTAIKPLLAESGTSIEGLQLKSPNIETKRGLNVDALEFNPASIHGLNVKAMVFTPGSSASSGTTSREGPLNPTLKLEERPPVGGRPVTTRKSYSSILRSPKPVGATIPTDPPKFQRSVVLKHSTVRSRASAGTHLVEHETLVNQAFDVLKNEKYTQAEQKFRHLLGLRLEEGVLKRATIGLARSLNEQGKSEDAKALLLPLRTAHPLTTTGVSSIKGLDLCLSRIYQSLGSQQDAETLLLRLSKKSREDTATLCNPSHDSKVDLALARIWQDMGETALSECLLLAMRRKSANDDEENLCRACGDQRLDLALARLWQSMNKNKHAESLLLSMSRKSAADSEEILCKPCENQKVNLALARQWQDMHKYKRTEKLLLAMSNKKAGGNKELLCKPCNIRLVDLALVRHWKRIDKNELAERLLLTMRQELMDGNKGTPCVPCQDNEINLTLIHLWLEMSNHKAARKLFLEISGRSPDTSDEALACQPCGIEAFDIAVVRILSSTAKERLAEELLLKMSKTSDSEEVTLHKSYDAEKVGVILARLWQKMGKMKQAEELLLKMSKKVLENNEAVLYKPCGKTEIDHTLACQWMTMGKMKHAEKLLLAMSSESLSSDDKAPDKLHSDQKVNLSLARLWGDMYEVKKAEKLLLTMSGKSLGDDEAALCTPCYDNEVDLALAIFWHNTGKKEKAEKLLLAMSGKPWDSTETNVLCKPCFVEKNNLALVRLWDGMGKTQLSEKLLLAMRGKGSNNGKEVLCEPCGNTATDHAYAVYLTRVGEMKCAEKLLLAMSGQTLAGDEKSLYKPHPNLDVNLTLASLWTDVHENEKAEILLLKMSGKSLDDDEAALIRPTQEKVDLALAIAWGAMGKGKQAEKLLLVMSHKPWDSDESTLCQPSHSMAIDLTLARIWRTMGNTKRSEKLLLALSKKPWDSDNLAILCKPSAIDNLDRSLSATWEMMAKYKHSECLLLAMTKKRRNSNVEAMCEPSDKRELDLSLAFIWRHLGEFKLAENLLKNILKKESSHEAQHILLSLYTGTDQFVKEIITFKDGVEKELLWSIHYFELATREIEKNGPTNQTREWLEYSHLIVTQAIDQYPNSAGLYSQKSHCLRMLGKKESEWSFYFDRARAINPLRSYRVGKHGIWRDREQKALRKIGR